MAAESIAKEFKNNELKFGYELKDYSRKIK